MFARRVLWVLGAALSVWLLFTISPGAARAALSALPSPDQPHAVIPACDPITTNTTWTTGNIYVVQDCDLTIAAGATLTVQPGVIVKFGGTAPGYGSALGSVAVLVDGALNAVGTVAQPVVFTSLADDAHGGDTNGNGPSSGAAGDWYGIVFRSGSSGQLTQFFVGYAGSGVFNATLGYGRAQVDVRQAAVQLRNGEITAGKKAGVYLEGAGLTPTIQDVRVADNRAADGRGYAVYQATVNMQPTYSGLLFSSNDRNEVTIGNWGEELTQDATLGGAAFGFDCGYTLCLLTVPAGRTLTVAPGAQLAFKPAFGIAVASGGALLAEGTVSQPITFTSAATAGAATRGAAAPLAGEWIGLWAQSGSTLRLAHCDISHADDTNFGKGGLEINTGDAQVQNCRIHHNRRNGLYIYSRDGASIAPSLSNVEVTDNGEHGVYLTTSGGSVNAPTWQGGRVADNGYSGVYVYNFAGQGIVQATLRDLAISGNGSAAAGDPARAAGVYAPDPNTSLTLENLTLTNNVGIAVHWRCNGSITARNLTAAGNSQNELLIPGCDVSSGRQWDLGDAGIPARVTGHVNVTQNALLSILPGTALRFDKNQYNSPTRLEVQDQASLNALGTADRPVVFIGATQTPGWWEGIYAKQRAALTLRHCEIGYGGANTTGSLLVRWGWPNTGVPAANIQNCEIHHSSRKGVHFDFGNFTPITTPPVFHYNHLHDNAEEAVANWNAPPLDARQNYWGDPSGPYHATQNPGGLGDNVGDNILFYPWLTAPTGGEIPGEMLVSTGAPNQVSPGETVDYAIQYLNDMTSTVQSSILMLQLPQAAYFLEGTAGAVYWPDRHQVFWKLDDLLPGASGFVSARVRFQWGLPADYSDGSYTQFAGSNYNAGALNVAEYNAYETSAPRVAQMVELSADQFAAVRTTSADLEELYKMTLADGYQFLSAARITYVGGRETVNAAFRTADRKYGRILSLGDGRALASTVGGGVVAVRDMTGGLNTDLHTQTYEFWGSWATAGAAAANDGDRGGGDRGGGDRGGSPLQVGADCGEARCFANCMLKAKSWGKVASKVAAAVSWVIPPLGAAWTTYEVYDEITTYLECKDDCRMAGTRSNHCCTAGDVRWAPTGLKQQCARYSCDAVGTWKQTPDIIEKCGFGERCVAGAGTDGGCKDCEEDLIAAHFSPVALRAEPAACLAGGGNPRCSDLSLRLAKDPNAIYGQAGDLLPGQVVTYTITYENEGEGRAYGVYVVNRLPDVFNASTLTFVNKTGAYLPATREVVWLVGELAPKGQAGSTGVITYTVALTGGLSSGAVVANQAVVYFPSVPEETPTNTWVNLVSPLVATPQQVTTNYRTPVAITLSGREASGLPLTYEIVEPPHGGTLTGDAPNPTYTPAENFTGPDAFTFRVSNGTSTSRPAEVRIEVQPTGDTTPPTVLWTSPEADATGVVASVAPVYTDTIGPVYAPVILIGMSEPLNPATVTTATVTLAREGGAAVTASVSFDGGTNQIVLAPRAALSDGRYVVTVTTGVQDAAGNALAAVHSWRFTVGAAERRVYLPLVLRN